MPTRDEKWPAGTPCWVDMQADRPHDAGAFYAQLFGWTLEGRDDDDPRGYLVASLDGRAVAGIGPRPDPAVPSVWTTYIAVDDADEHVESAKAAGGLPMSPPFDVGSSGRMSLIVAADGSVYGIWQAGEQIGVGVCDEPGALCWNELHTGTYDRSKEYYGKVFGWGYGEVDDADVTYSMVRADGREVGGIALDTDKPAGIPNYWLAWFAVHDVDAVAAKAVGLGALTLAPATDSPFGRMVALQGPQGEAFGVIDLAAATGSPPAR